LLADHANSLKRQGLPAVGLTLLDRNKGVGAFRNISGKTLAAGLTRYLPTPATFSRNEQPKFLPESKKSSVLRRFGVVSGIRDSVAMPSADARTVH
jgi:hypothetical protein